MILFANFKGNIEPLADRYEKGFPREAEILLGVDYIYSVVKCNIKKSDGFVAIDTIFGFCLCGYNNADPPKARASFPINQTLMAVVERKREKASRECAKKKQISGNQLESVNAFATLIKSKADSEDIAVLWETEVMGIEPYCKETDESSNEELNQYFRETVRRNQEGRYQISWPFKPNKHLLGVNRQLTESRLRGFLAIAKKNKKLLEAVDTEISDLLKQGFIESTTTPEPGAPAHYLSLLAVAKKATTSAAGPGNLKVRVVNDAGARAKDEAGLNDVLFQGENLIADIIAVILQFRQQKIVITADIQKAYLQYEVLPEHRTFLRFLWPLGISKNAKAPIREFNSCKLSFGLISAP